MARRYAILIAVSFAFAILSALSPTANAQPAPPNGAASGPPPGPPPEAVAACNGKTAGTTVSFTGRRGETLTGICQLAGGVLAARPTGNDPPPRR